MTQLLKAKRFLLNILHPLPPRREGKFVAVDSGDSLTTEGLVKRILSRWEGKVLAQMQKNGMPELECRNA